MAQAVITNPQGQLLINSLDSNNDSPIQLAAYRGHYDMFMTLAQNNAFLDQPNAAGEDAIDAIQNPKEKARILADLSKLPTLSQANKNRLEAEHKKNLASGTPVPIMSNDRAPQTSSSPMAPPPLATSSMNPQQREGHAVFEQVMNNQNSYIMSTPPKQQSSSPSPQRRTTSMSPIPVLSPTKSSTQEFDLLPPMEEFYQDDEIAVVSLVPANGFFFTPKTTTFDRIGGKD